MTHSVYSLFLQAVGAYSSRKSVMFKKNQQWVSLTWKELYDWVRHIAEKLAQLDVQPQDRIAILCKTRVEWTVVDLAAFYLRACVVPIYHSSTADDVAFVLHDSQAKIIIVEDAEQLQKIREKRSQFVHLKHVICLESNKELLETELHWEKLNQDRQTYEIETDFNSSADELASIVYTSGTTGEPKGAMITHGNLLYEAMAAEKVKLVNSEDVQLLFLPLAHIFARVMQIAWLKTTHVLAYAESVEKAMDNMVEIQPTLMAAVPRIYEKIHAKVVQNALAGGGVKAMLARFAFAKSEEVAKAKKKGQFKDSLGWKVARKLVFSKISERLKERTGGKLRFFISGGAALSSDIIYFFAHANIMILEGYGLTETSAATFLNLPEHQKIGSVGRPMPGTDVRIASDGEILIKGPGVFKGYWQKPEATAEAFEDGWFHSGDIGFLDSDRFLTITDRKKDVIVTTAGKKIAPQKVENVLKMQSSYISHALVCGDGKNFISALITLDEQGIRDWAKKQKFKMSYLELLESPQARKLVEDAIQKANVQLAKFEQIKKFHILPKDFVIGEELTPTLKVKRQVCQRKYADLIAKFYPQDIK